MRATSLAPATKPRPSKRRPETSVPKRAPKKKPQSMKPRQRSVISHDDTTPHGGQFGATELARTDSEDTDIREAESIETLSELEREIGIADWIDPQTGEPAEGQSPPHLDGE